MCAAARKSISGCFGFLPFHHWSLAPWWGRAAAGWSTLLCGFLRSGPRSMLQPRCTRYTKEKKKSGLTHRTEQAWKSNMKSNIEKCFWFLCCFLTYCSKATSASPASLVTWKIAAVRMMKVALAQRLLIKTPDWSWYENNWMFFSTLKAQGKLKPPFCLWSCSCLTTSTSSSPPSFTLTALPPLWLNGHPNLLWSLR